MPRCLSRCHPMALHRKLCTFISANRCSHERARSLTTHTIINDSVVFTIKHIRVFERALSFKSTRREGEGVAESRGNIYAPRQPESEDQRLQQRVPALLHRDRCSSVELFLLNHFLFLQSLAAVVERELVAGGGNKPIPLQRPEDTSACLSNPPGNCSQKDKSRTLWHLGNGENTRVDGIYRD